MFRSRSRALLVISVSAVAVLTSCTAGSPESASPSSRAPASAAAGDQRSAPGREPRVVASGLDAPWSVTTRDRMTLVSERDSARILEIADDGSIRTVGAVAGVAGAGEGGLLGLAMDQDQRLYVYSTAENGNRIQRFSVRGAAGSLELGDAETLVDGIPSARYHNGGRIAFGPDGMLYATTGDAGQPDNAQDLESLAGKILRMEPNGAVPKDNPFPGSLVYSYGHRNAQGLAWDAEGTMYATEFGQNTWDELNIITPGFNYGWPAVEGTAGSEEFTDPVRQWEPGVASPSGMAYLNGTLFIANLRGQVLRAVPVSDPGTSTDHYRGELGRLRDVLPGPNGELWLLTNNTDGRGTPGPKDDHLLNVAVPGQ